MKLTASVEVACPSCGKDPSADQVSRMAVLTMLKCDYCGSMNPVTVWIRRVITTLP